MNTPPGTTPPGTWLGWSAAGAALAACAVFPWLWNARYRAWEGFLQEHLFGIPFTQAPPHLRIDHHLHVLLACAGTLWLAWLLGRWGRRWWAVPAGLVMIVGDEVLQLAAPARTFGVDDLLSGLIGIALAALLLALRPGKAAGNSVDS